MKGWRCGWLFRWGSCWVGAHWSSYNKRLCINFVPCVTLWVCMPGGITPHDAPAYDDKSK